MERPNFQPIFTKKSDFCERVSSQPVKTFIPNQAIKLSELVSRFEHGQRLNVHSNFAPGDNFTNDQIISESFDDAPPDDVHDIVDVHEYYQQHESHKREFKDRMKKKKEESQQAQPQEPAKQDLPA